MKYLIMVIALAACEQQNQDSMQLVKKENPAAQAEEPVETETPTAEEGVQPSAKSLPEVNTAGMPEAGEETTAMKLTSANCVDPDLSKVLAGETLMLCNGSMGVGSYIPAVIPAAPDLTNLSAGNIRNGVSINGVVGNYVGAVVPGDCGNNGQVGCVTTSTYRAADLSNLTAANVKKGASVAGVVGDYPSTQNPLTGNSNVADLDAATFFAKIKTDASFEWFDAQGVRHEATGSSLIAAENVKAGVSFLNVTGSLAIDTVNPWDVKAGVTVNGVAGKIPVKCLPGNCGDGSNWVDLSPGGCEAYAAQNGQCTYKELTTGLTWRGTRNSAQYFSTWATAASDCASDGTGWRLPTVNELHQARLLKMKLGVSQSFNNKNNYHWASTAGNLTANEPGHFRVNMDPTGEINFSSHGGTTNLVKNDTNPEAETLLAVGICVKGP